jgi:hypothetical protein
LVAEISWTKNVLINNIAYSEKFRGAKSIEKKRMGVVCDCITTEFD